MSSSRRIHLSRCETTEVLRFVADVATRRDNPTVQRLFLVDELERRLGCELGFCYTAVGWLPGRSPRLTSAVQSSVSAPTFARYLRDVICEGVEADPFCRGTLARAGPVVCVDARDVMPDRDAERAFDRFVGYCGDVRMGHGAVCFARLDGAHGVGPARAAMFGVGLHRLDGGRRPLTPRLRATVMLAVAECAALIGRGHLAVPELQGGALDPLAALAPRLREVLGHLLDGHCPKQIARAMGLSLWTVREYQGALYRHFDVDGRDALMARFVRHAQGSSSSAAIVRPGRRENTIDSPRT